MVLNWLHYAYTWTLRRGVRWTSIGVALKLVCPAFLVMSTGSFAGIEISKACNKVANVSCITCSANDIPRHSLLPLPNGMYSKFWSLDMKHLVYFQVVIKETMRLYLAATLLVPQESIEDCTLTGYYWSS